LEPFADTVCEAELRSNALRRNRYGQHPAFENLVIDDQSACLIMPSDDQPASERGRALLVWQHPDAAVRSRTQRAVLVLLAADKRHIRDLGASLKFIGPWLPWTPWTPDPSTPAPPARDVKHFVSEYGVSFAYPANWFTSTHPGENWIVIQNAPVEGVVASEHGNDFRPIAVELKPEDATGYTSTLAYVDATLLWRLPKESVLSVEVLPPLSQGYEAVRATYLETGETVDLYVRNGARVVRLIMIYARGTRAEAKYLNVLDRIAATLSIP
jgi:hypothetical protein